MADVALTIALTGAEQVQSQLGQLGGIFSGMGAQLNDASARFTSFGKNLQSVGAQIAVQTAPAALLGATLIKSGADFEAAMNKIKVTSEGTTDQLQAVADKAQEIGARTTFSAGEAAEAFIALSRNGVTLDESLQGVVDAAVNLAAATGTGLGPAADIAAKAMQQFQVGAKDLPAMMDQLFNAAQNSTLELPQLAEALAQGGGAAATAGISFRDTVTALSTMAYNFASGSDAGTSFKTALISLAAPTAKQAEEAEKLGINIRDAAGNFLPMRDIVGQLETAFQGMGTAQKEEAATTLVGTDAFRALVSLADQGVAVWDKNTAAIDKMGTSQRAAAEMMKGFWGAVDQVSGALENLGIALKNSGFIDFLTSGLMMLQDFINWVAKVPAPVLNFAAALTAVAVAAGPVALAIGSISLVLGAILTPIGLVVAAIVGVGAVLTAGVVLWSKYGDAIKAFVADTIQLAVGWAGRIYDELVGGIEGAYTGVVSTLRELVDQFTAGLKTVIDVVTRFVGDFEDTLTGGIGKAVQSGVNKVKDLGSGIVNFFKGIPGQITGSAGATEKAIIAPYQGASDEIVGHSIIPEMVDKMIVEMRRFGPVNERVADDAVGDWLTFGNEAPVPVRAAVDNMGASLEDLVARHGQVMGGIAAGLQENNQQWDSWGLQISNAVTDFSAAATDQLATFFMTGEINTAAWTASLLGYMAELAARWIVHIIAMTIENVIFGHMTFLAGLEAALGLDTAAISALFLDTALAPILIVVLLIAAAFALLYLAGVDIGDIFAWIAEVVGAVLKGAFQAFMAVVGALVSIFSTLIDLMATFVGWIKTIGDELGKGDLKDLLDIFGGGNLFGGIGDIFGGIGDFFGGLFATGGWVGGSSGAVPIVAHAGEFVVNADSAARHAGLLEMINGGSDMHARVQTLGDFTGATVRDGSAGGGGGGPAGGGGGNGGITVHMHGSVISDGLSTSQVGRTLGRSIRKETKRLLGG